MERKKGNHTVRKKEQCNKRENAGENLVFSLIAAFYTPFVPLRKSSAVWVHLSTKKYLTEDNWKLKDLATLEIVVENVESTGTFFFKCIVFYNN